MTAHEYAIPEIEPVSDDDIRWASAVLCLPANAFTGPDGNDPRALVLRSNESIDVAASPGSGKTTLLVAKLAILSRKWPRAAQGICVLSHTNVARQEIEFRLATDVDSRAVLSYPHFVGTIHGFINTFLSLPFLRSTGTSIVAIDDEICLRKRWSKLTHANRLALEASRHTEEVLRIKDAHFDLGDIRWGRRGHLGRETSLYQALVEACRATTAEGYHCHNDMFIWAEQAIDKLPELVSAVRRRFPYLFIDEVQDNSERQSNLLYRLFMEGKSAVVRQRFGDMNQAIFGNSKKTEAVLTDRFPNRDRMINVPNSHRFGEQIASVCNPIAIEPPGLVGLRAHPDRHQTALLLFEPNEAHLVLPAYAQLIAEKFDEAQKTQGVFTAVGAVHKKRDDDNAPSSVSHYWDAYDPRGKLHSPAPETFLELVRTGIAASSSQDTIKLSVYRTAEAVIRLANTLNTDFNRSTRGNCHRQVRALLAHDPVAMERYSRLAWAISTSGVPKTAEKWQRWKPQIIKICAAMLSGLPMGNDSGFLDWVEDEEIDKPSNGRNLYGVPLEIPLVKIRVGSIHSVKGETHLATLVVDTHYHGSHFQRIRNWLTGVSSGLPRGGGEHLQLSLKQHYVAMTRPSHLLCLAMRRNDITAEELNSMRERHWQIGVVSNTGTQWL
jgi:DNA helicase-2/ATP-dependent DNA helicase PcrA